MAVKPLLDIAKDWTKINPMDQKHAEPFKNITNMPNFDVTKLSDFQALNADAPRLLLENVFKRFPAIPHLYLEHPAFKVALLKMYSEKSGQPSNVDWQWHREALKQAREMEELHRILKRTTVEKNERERHAEMAKLTTEDMRTYFFKVAIESRLQQNLMFNKLKNESALDQKHQRLDLLDLSNDRKWEAFLVLFKMELRPTKKYLAKNMEIARTQQTVSQLANEAKIKVTPAEFLLRTVLEAMPYAHAEEIQQILNKWTAGLQVVNLYISEAAAFKKRISKIFLSTFLTNDQTHRFQKQASALSLEWLKNQRNFNVTKADQAAERQESFVVERSQNSLDDKIHFDKVVNDIHSNRRVINTYVENDLLHRKKKILEERFLPMTIEGVTEYVQFHPIKFRTQYGVIKSWVNHVEALYFRRQGNQDEVSQLQMDNDSNTAKEINKSSLEDAVELNRIEDAYRVRYLFQNYTIGQISKMFAATEEAASLMRQHQQNFYDEKINRVLDLQSSAAVHKIKKIPQMDEVS